jgi:hypothetical protein
VVSDKEKAPRVGGAEVKRGRTNEGTDWLKARPAMLVADLPVNRNASQPGADRLSAHSDERQLRYFLVTQKFKAKSLLRLAMDDSKNNHKAETEVGLRLIRQPS